MTHRFTRRTLPFLILACSATARPQGMPTTQPAMLQIGIEEIKLGRDVEHGKNEAGWPAAFTKAKSKYNYLALVSMTGRNEVWYVSPYANHAAMADGMKANEDDPALAAELARLYKADAEFLASFRSLQARGRPDLSYGTFPNLAKQHFTEITWFRVRPGHEAGFEAASKAYGSAAKRSAPTTSYRVYEVIAGVPGPTYLIFSSVGGFAEFDKGMAAGEATMKGATKDEMNTLTKFSAEGVLNTETQRFRVDPAQSFVPKETRDQDPAFWYPKKPAAKTP